MDESKEIVGLRRPASASLWLLGSLAIVFLIGQLATPARYIFLDQVAWYEEARSILLTRALSVDESVRVSANWAYVTNNDNRKCYSKYGLFNGLICVPPLALELAITGVLEHEANVNGEAFANPTRILIVGQYYVMLSVGIAFLLWSVTGWYIESPWKRSLFVFVTVYCTTLWHYLRLPTSELTQVGLFLLFWLFFLRFNRRQEPIGIRPRRYAFGAWCALLLLCQTRVADLFILPIFGAYLCWLAWRSNLRSSVKLRFVLTTAALPVAFILVAQGLVHSVKFGSPFLSGYHQYWEAPNPHTTWQVLREFTFHPQWSFFLTFPPLFLALPGWRTYMRRHLVEAVILLACLLGMFAIVEPLPFWRGELAYGPRYFLFLMPVLSLPALYAIDRLCWGFMIPILLVAIFLMAAQFQVQRFEFFDWRRGFRELAGDSAQVQEYFDTTPVPKICWDHLRCRVNLEDLPYYSFMAAGKTPESLNWWKQDLRSKISVSNLYWFPDINK